MHKFYFNLDLEPITFIDEVDLKILKMYLHTKKLSRSRLSKVRALWTDRQTDRWDRKHYDVAFAGGIVANSAVHSFTCK